MLHTKQTYKTVQLLLLRCLHVITTGKRKYVLAGMLSLTAIVACTLFLYPRSATFSYADQTCIQQPVLFPNLQREQSSDDIALNYTREFKVGAIPVLARAVCVQLKRIPETKRATVRTALFGLSMLRTAYTIHLPELPSIEEEVFDQPISIHKPVMITLSQLDAVFTYTLAVQDREVVCVSAERAISCDISTLKLRQGTRYEMKLIRSLNATDTEELVRTTMQTLTATTITSASIAQDELVFDKPKSITFQADKPLKRAAISITYDETGGRKSVAGRTVVEGDKIIFIFDGELARSRTFTVSIDELEATDGSALNEVFTTLFSTSGGPQVQHVSVAAYGIDPNATIAVIFDQVLDAQNEVSEFASIEGASAYIHIDGSRVLFSLVGIERCRNFTLRISGRITSVHGVSDHENWSYGSRTRCHSTTAYGYSVNGRPLLAYYFGSGSETLLYVGATHGNERSSGLLMDRWVAELEARYDEIPANKRVVVVPRVNPDAYIANTRRNSRNVDLNRNFPTAAWKSDVTMPGGLFVPGGGGSEPLSEPESRALANLTLGLSPKLVLTYHAVASVVIANESGISVPATAVYAQRSGYRNEPKAATAEIFEYDTTGAYEDWLFEQPSIATILIELGSLSSSQFEKNQPAMWSMLSL